MLSRGFNRSIVAISGSKRFAHTDKSFPDLSYYRVPAVRSTTEVDFIDAQIREKELRKATFYTLNAALTSSIVWFAANVVCQCVNVLNPSQDRTSLSHIVYLDSRKKELNRMRKPI